MLQYLFVLIDQIKLMKKMKKFLRIDRIELMGQQQHPKQISRAHFRITDQQITPKQQGVFKTSLYGIVSKQEVAWQSAIELPYTAQQTLKFDTICEHEYGYEKVELKALYNGIIYLKPDHFFDINTYHYFNEEGRQCGSVKMMIKIVEREQQNTNIETKFEEPKERISVELIAKVSIYAANFVINSYNLITFNKKKKRNLQLELEYEGKLYKGASKHSKDEYKWGFSTSKFEVSDHSPPEILLRIFEDGHPFMDGVLEMATVEERKRFTVQIVMMSDCQTKQRIGTLHLDMRYISKKELLDLMYSPKLLADSTMDVGRKDKHFKHKDRSSSAMDSLASHAKKEPDFGQSRHSEQLQKQYLAYKKKPYSKRYQNSILSNHLHEGSFSKSPRFESIKSYNFKSSYVNPLDLSDFSPKNASPKNLGFSSTPKVDFTKPIKHNPGVGLYHLPSIFENRSPN